MVVRINMDQPLMTIVDSLVQQRNLSIPGFALEDWEDEIQRLAPGYLALEAQGREIEYDLADLWNEEGLFYNHYTLAQKKHYRETGSYYIPPPRFVPPPRQPIPAPALPTSSNALGESFLQLFKDKLATDLRKE